MENKKDYLTSIRCEKTDYYTVSKWLKKCKRSWAWFIHQIALMIKQNESVNLTKLFGLARKKEGRAVNVWKEDENYKPMKETFDFLDEEDEPNPEKWWLK